MLNKKALLLALLVSTSANAQVYGTISFGKSKFNNPVGVWHDFKPITYYGFSWVAMEQSNTWSIGLGKKYRWGSLEAAFHDFGETKSYAGYPYDEGSPSLPSECDYPCTAPQWVYHYGTAQGISLSALPEYSFWKNAGLFARFGATLYRATFEYHIADIAQSPNRRASVPVKWEPTYAISPMYGIGIRLGHVSLEVSRHQKIEAKHPEHQTGSFQQIDTVTISYRVPL